MTRYQEESQRAAGAARRFPSHPKPRVTPGGLNALRTGPNPSVSTVPTPAHQTSRREHHSACQLSRTAAMRAGSARSSAHRRPSGLVWVPAPAGALRGAASSPAFSRMASSTVSEFMFGWRRAAEVAAAQMAGNHTPSGNLGTSPEMSRQARQRRQRHNRSGPVRFLLIGGGVLTVALIAGAGATVGYVLSVARSAPAIGALHPILSGGRPQVFASDGTRPGFIQSRLE